MKTYTVQTRFEFEGAFEIRAESKQEARRVVEKHCGLVMGGNIHTIDRMAVSYWNFPIHPEKMIISVKNRKMSRK